MAVDKTTVRFTQTVIEVMEAWKKAGWEPQKLVNAALVLFQMADAKDRETAQRFAYDPTGQCVRLSPIQVYKAAILDITTGQIGLTKDERDRISDEIIRDPRLAQSERAELLEQINRIGALVDERDQLLARSKKDHALSHQSRRAQNRADTG